ncbi:MULTISPECIES: YoaK family protein [Caldimonas]|uniref:YoaK family protein n=1 Tax=Caldimonas TaxID=196013 RepID=UPI000781F60C|nr:YoaK family protein [Caldimonas taiwanensis]
MPVPTLRRLLAPQRSPGSNRKLGRILAFVAGAINAGGFLAVHRYTSHMTGIVSAIADDLVLGQMALALGGAASVGAFVAGAATTAGFVHWARRRQMHSEYALSLLLEAVLLLVFGLMGAHLAWRADLIVPATVLLLCFVMGLQNALITKISRAEIRTTHMTGILTDLGIELGRLFYWNRDPRANAQYFVRANRDRLRLHAQVLGCFLSGGIVGAAAFKSFGFVAAVPLAVLLAALAVVPVLDDVRRMLAR